MNAWYFLSILCYGSTIACACCLSIEYFGTAPRATKLVTVGYRPPKRCKGRVAPQTRMGWSVSLSLQLGCLLLRFGGVDAVCIGTSHRKQRIIPHKRAGAPA